MAVRSPPCCAPGSAAEAPAALGLAGYLGSGRAGRSATAPGGDARGVRILPDQARPACGSGFPAPPHGGSTPPLAPDNTAPRPLLASASEAPAPRPRVLGRGGVVSIIYDLSPIPSLAVADPATCRPPRPGRAPAATPRSPHGQVQERHRPASGPEGATDRSPQTRPGPGSGSGCRIIPNNVGRRGAVGLCSGADPGSWGTRQRSSMPGRGRTKTPAWEPNERGGDYIALVERGDPPAPPRLPVPNTESRPFRLEIFAANSR